MKRIAIICDFHKNSGFGHFTRMVSLSKSFKKKLCDVIFLFELKNKEFIQSFTKDLKCEYLSLNLKKNSYKIKKYLTKKKIDIVIFDSYYVDIKLERSLYKNFFLVSIDDKILNHNSHLVFNSREDLSSYKFSKLGQRWFTGKKFILMNKTKKKIKKNLKIKKILIHAGGSSVYKLINNFFSTSVKYLSNKNVKVDILYNNNKTFTQIKRKINNLISSNIKFKLLKFNKSFSKKLFNYDIIAGPAGTTTFEAMSSGVLTFSFPLLEDGRDSMLSWNLLGNVTHLNSQEKNDRYIVQSMWDYIFFNFKKLDLNAKKNSIYIRDNSKTISGLIKKYFNQKSLLLKKPQNTKDSFLIKKISFKYVRSFLTSRNSLKVRKVSSNPKHIISLPEHLKWWENPRIKKFILVKNKKIPSAYHWIKPLNVNKKKIIVSGWFLDLKEKQNLKTSFKVIKHQKELIKRHYKGYNWLININKDNNLSIRMNESIGFKKASKISFKTAYEIFQFDKKNFNVYEMKI